MTYYWDDRFISKIDHEIKTIFEVGARHGDESVKLSQSFPNSKIFSFECNPLTVESCRTKLADISNVTFIPCGLGSKNEMLPFYSYIKNNHGCSSFLKRIDFNETQKLTGYMPIDRIDNIVKSFDIESIDLLCMDVQGFELNVLKGSGDFIKNIKYVIMEEPKPIIDLRFLPKDTYSKYLNAPSPIEISNFMKENNFTEIVRIPENHIEDNVMYKKN